MSKFAKKAAASEEQEVSTKSTRFSKKADNDTAPAKAPKAAKAEKAAKKPKAEKVAKDDSERTPRASNDERKIIVTTKVNPHREGSGRYEAYEAAKSSKRVSDYAATGNKVKYLAKWEEAGFLELKE